MNNNPEFRHDWVYGALGLLLLAVAAVIATVLWWPEGGQ